jgi:hypothetical protein
MHPTTTTKCFSNVLMLWCTIFNQEVHASNMNSRRTFAASGLLLACAGSRAAAAGALEQLGGAPNLDRFIEPQSSNQITLEVTKLMLTT